MTIFNSTKSLEEQELFQAFQTYQAAIIRLESDKKHLTFDHLREALNARCHLQAALDHYLLVVQKTPERPQVASILEQARIGYKQWLKQLDELDKRFALLADVIHQSIRLKDWQFFLTPQEQKWLFWFEGLPQPKTPWHDYLDGVWQFLSVLCFGISFVLLCDIIQRSMTGGIDLGSAGTTLIATFVSLLSGGGLLTKMGQEQFEKFASFLNIKENLWDEFRCLLSLLCLGFLIGFWLSLPIFANYYIEAAQKAENLARQEVYYHRAIALKPDSLEAHLALAKLYASQQDYDKALEKFKKTYHNTSQKNRDIACEAAEGITQLFIDQKEFDKADRWLQNAMKVDLSSNQPSQYCQRRFDLVMMLGRNYLQSKSFEAMRWFQDGLKRLSNNNRLKENQMRYELLVNLGRSQLNAGLLDEAKNTLYTAIDLDKNKIAIHAGVKQRPAAFCLYAQVLEKESQKGMFAPNSIRSYWENCSSHSSSDENADEIKWKQIATERLKPKLVKDNHHGS